MRNELPYHLIIVDDGGQIARADSNANSAGRDGKPPAVLNWRPMGLLGGLFDSARAATLDASQMSPAAMKRASDDAVVRVQRLVVEGRRAMARA